VGGGQWAVGSGQWAVGSGQWAVGGGQWAVGAGAWSLEPGAWSLEPGEWNVENYFKLPAACPSTWTAAGRGAWRVRRTEVGRNETAEFFLGRS